jgi:hypothetical protein
MNIDYNNYDFFGEQLGPLEARVAEHLRHHHDIVKKTTLLVLQALDKPRKERDDEVITQQAMNDLETVPPVIEYVKKNTGKLPRLLAFLRNVSYCWPHDEKDFEEDWPIVFNTDLEYIEQQLRVFADVHGQIVLANPGIEPANFPKVLHATLPAHHPFYATLGPLGVFFEQLEELLHYIWLFPNALSDLVREQTFFQSTRWGQIMKRAGLHMTHFDLFVL